MIKALLIAGTIAFMVAGYAIWGMINAISGLPIH